MPAANHQDMWPQGFDFEQPDEVLLLLEANEQPLLDLTDNLLVGEARLASMGSSDTEAIGFFIHAENKFLGEEHALFTATRKKGHFFPLTLKTHPTLADITTTLIIKDLKTFEIAFRALLKSKVTAERVRYLMSRTLGIREDDVA
jgi:hypothetical protein